MGRFGYLESNPTENVLPLVLMPLLFSRTVKLQLTPRSVAQVPPTRNFKSTKKIAAALGYAGPSCVCPAWA